ncbi:MAG: murein biosynthesis integral membrane protein MurJ [Gammaproteobacteria bacterium]|nr:murein biosynthesis integral membrane protein MurJ [Gammaproteobacteria bacterium]
MKTGLLRSIATVGQMTMVSRVLGLVRDVVIARTFGSTLAADAFFVAFKIPNLFRRLVAEGAFAQAFVPVLAESRARQEHAAVRELVSAVSYRLLAVLGALTLLGVIAAPVFIAVVAFGFIDEPEKFNLAAAMLRITFPYLALISLASLAGGILNTYRQFAVPAFTPVLLNVALIAAATLLAPRLEQPVMALAWGVLLGGAAQLAFQLPYVARLGLLVWPRWRSGHEGVRRILRLMLPAVFGASVAQINMLIDTVLASLLVTGSISWLYYSDRLMELPLAVLGIAFGTVILPSLSDKHSNGETEAFSHTLDWALRLAFILGVPATLGLILLAEPILITVFQYGAMSAHDVHQSSHSLRAYAFGLMGLIAIKVLAPGFYSRQDTRTPVKVGLGALAINLLLNVALMVPLRHAGLALATSLAAYFNAVMLGRILLRQGVYRPEPGWMKLLARLFVAGVAMSLPLAFSGDAETIWLARTMPSRVIWLGVWIGAAAGVYFVVLALLGVRFSELRAPRSVSVTNPRASHR